MKTIKSYILGAAAAVAVTMGFSACQDDFDDIKINAPQATSTPNTTIAELKEKFWNDATNYAVKITDEADPSKRIVISGRVISSDVAGNVFKSLVIQDETAALAMSVNSYNLYLNYRVGQEIVMDVTDMYIGKYAGLQQLGTPSWYANGDTWQVSFMSPEYFYEHAELNGWPEPAAIDTISVPTFGSIGSSPAELQKWQSQLVRFQNVHFQEGGTNTFSKYHTSANEDQNRTLVDSNGATMTVRTSGYANFCEDILPAGNIDLVGILSYYNTAWQIILIDADGCIAVGERPGTEDNPYTVDQAIENEQNEITTQAWVRGYIVGAVAPEVESVAANEDIQWEAPFILNNTVVIANAPDVKDYTKCMVVSLPSESVFQQMANLRDNAGNLGKELIVYGNFVKYLGTYGLTGNNGTAAQFRIEGVDVPSNEIPEGDGQEATPYNTQQVVLMNPSSTTTAVETGVWVKGYIVGSMPTGGSSTTLSGTNFDLTDAATTNLVIGPTPDCTDASRCVGIQLPTGAIRNALNLSANPGNLGKELAVKGDIMKYCGGPGVKNLTAYTLGEGGGDTPVTPPAQEAVTSLDVTFEGSTNLPAGWTDVTIAGNKTWYVRNFDENNYATMSGYNGTAPFDEWLVSPAIDMSKVSDKKLSFRTQVNGYGSTTTEFNVYVLTSADVANATRTKLSASYPTAPESGYSNWVNSGEIDLSAYTGTIYIGFQYYATPDANFATWCVDDIKLNSGSGSTEPEEPSDPTEPSDPAQPGASVTIQATSITEVPGTSTVDGYTIVIDKASGSTAPAAHAGTSAVRLYADNTMEISGSGKMAKIVFTLAKDAAARYTTVSASTGEISPAQAAGDTSFTWVGNADKVTFTVGHDATLGTDGATKRGQIRFTALEIFKAE